MEKVEDKNLNDKMEEILRRKRRNIEKKARNQMEGRIDKKSMERRWKREKNGKKRKRREDRKLEKGKYHDTYMI